MEQESRYLSEEAMQRIRDSVAQGVERVVKPFITRVERQSKIVVDPRLRIGGWGDEYCHPELQDGKIRIRSKSFVGKAA